jgi:hypothetical protein
MHDRPRARTEGVVSERIDGELVVYDAATQTAHCLSPEAASVWDRCGGDLSILEIADRLELPSESVEHALAALRECGLLDEGPVAVDDGAASGRAYSRREAAFRLAKVGGAAFAGPLVYSVAVGTAQAAFSGTPFPACGTTGAATLGANASGCNVAQTGSTAVGAQPPADTCNGTTGTSGACTGARMCGAAPTGGFNNTSCCYGVCHSTADNSCGSPFICATQFNCVLGGDQCPDTSGAGEFGTCGPGPAPTNPLNRTGTLNCCRGTVICGGASTLNRPRTTSGRVANFGCCSGVCDSSNTTGGRTNGTCTCPGAPTASKPNGCLNT